MGRIVSDVIRRVIGVWQCGKYPTYLELTNYGVRPWKKERKILFSPPPFSLELFKILTTFV